MANLAQGSLELLLALNTPSPKGYAGIPALVWGAPGTGKSTFIESLQTQTMPVVTMIASLHDPTDFNGLPMLVNGKMTFAPPDWIDIFEQAKSGILFLDELTTAPPTVQAALLRLVLERKVGSYELPPDVRIAAAANPPDIAASGWELSPPLANRFVHIEWELTGEAYRTALEQGGFKTPDFQPVPQHLHSERSLYWKALTAGFLKRSPASVNTQPATDEYAFASPRTWDYAVALMATCDVYGYAPKPGQPSPANPKPFINLLKGCIGSGAATAFIQYIRQLRIPDPEQVLNGAVQVDPNLREDELMVLFSAMGSLLRRYEQEAPGFFPNATAHFLKQALRVAEANKSDSIYITIRSTIQEGLLQKAAHAQPAIRDLAQNLSDYYEGLTSILE